MGFSIAYRKAARASSLTWIGMHIGIHDDRVEVVIPPDKKEEIRRIILRFLAGNIVPDKELWTFVGKCMSIASVLHVWKPFMSQLYATLHVEKSLGAPRSGAWTSQIRSGLFGY